MIGAALSCAALAGCQNAQPSFSTNDTPETATAIAPLNACNPISVEPSLVVRTQSIIGAADFSFNRTMTQIGATAGTGGFASAAALAQNLINPLNTSVFVQPESSLPIPADIRTAELALTGAGLVTQMRPIALFNRFDLAPADGSNCGEYRIVYGRYPNNTFTRFLLIFEAVLPNPTGTLSGCQPVQQFWHDLADPVLTDAQRATMLADFYYVGLPGFGPVVNFDNYGSPLGQIRSNMFMMQPWQLREYRTAVDGGGIPVLVPDTDKDNPLAEFYNELSSNPNPSLFGSEHIAFRNDFFAQRLGNLTAAEHAAAANGTPIPTGCNLVNTIGAGFPNRFNEFQANSQNFVVANDEPSLLISSNFTFLINTAIAGDPALAGLNSNHVINRAGTVTCGGCHQFSVGDPIGPTTSWPGVAPGGFVHVSELGINPPAVAPLSPALTSCFLPGRAAIMHDFLCPPPPADAGVSDTGISDSGQADSGGAPDSGVAPDSGLADAGGSPDSGIESCDVYHPCAADQYCEFGLYNVCGSAGPGVCQPRPTSCGYGSEVCGCDGQTYSSECDAQMAGTDVASQGACGGSCSGTPPSGCCFEDTDCKSGLCVGESCSVGQAGVCKNPPMRRGECWEDSQCGLGEICDGELICGCGNICRFQDTPGQCIRRPRKTVSTAKAAVRDAKDSAEAARAVLELEAEIARERAADRAKAGAFTPVRRTH